MFTIYMIHNSYKYIHAANMYTLITYKYVINARTYKFRVSVHQAFTAIS